MVSLPERPATAATLPADPRPLPSVTAYDELLRRRTPPPPPITPNPRRPSDAHHDHARRIRAGAAPGRPPARPVTRRATAIDSACRELRLPTIRARVRGHRRRRRTRTTVLLGLPRRAAAGRVRRPGPTPRRPPRPRSRLPPRRSGSRTSTSPPTPTVNPATIATLATGGWVTKGEPLCLIGDSGTGKTHLLIALGTAAAEAGTGSATPWPPSWSTNSSRPPTTRQLPKTIARYGRVDLLCIDELGYMELDRRGAELLFQVLTEREEKNRRRHRLQRNLQRLDQDLHRPPALRRHRRPAHLRRPHHRDRHREDSGSRTTAHAKQMSEVSPRSASALCSVGPEPLLGAGSARRSVSRCRASRSTSSGSAAGLAVSKSVRHPSMRVRTSARVVRSA